MNEAARILLIEDDEDIRYVVQAHLERHMFVVSAASNGLDAFEFLLTSKNPNVDVIVLDLSMPVVDGITFRRIQCGNEFLSRIPVVLFSSEPGIASLAESLKCKGFSQKDCTTLISEIDKVLQ